MAIESSAPRSRRALLAAAAGAAAASVVAAIDRPSPVRAGSDGDVVLGAENVATTTTTISNTANDSDVLTIHGTLAANVIWGENLGDGTGVAGTSDAGHGVEGTSKSGFGVFGASETGTGVHGRMEGSGFGVHGHGEAPGSIGVYASTASLVGGTALQVAGRVRFSRSGRALIAEGRSYIDVDLASKGGLAGTPLCFANLTSHRPGTWVSAVRPNYPGTGKIRIYLNRSATSPAYVAWMVLN